MDKKELQFILQEGEGLKTEFKSSLSDLERITEIVCSLANSKGGIILIGVSDTGNICGVDIGKQTIERLTNIVVDNLDPKIYVEIKSLKIDKKNIILFEVEESADKPHLAYGRAFIRVAKNTKLMSRAEYERLLLKRRPRIFDAQTCEEAAPKDIDREFITKIFVPKYELVTATKLAGAPEKLLAALGCIKNSKPTNGGILLFGKSPQNFYPNAYIALARYKGHDVGRERLDYKEFNGNIFQQIDECNKYIEEHIAIMSRLVPHKVEREDIPEYPLFSIRELITNAVVHRDYSIRGSKVIIKMFDNKIEFYNPGGLPTGITPKNISKKQFSKNPILTKALSKIRYIEEVGEGWDKIIKEHKTHPLKPKLPKIEADEHSVLVEIFSTKDKFEKEKRVKEPLGLNPRQKKVVEYVEKVGKIDRLSYCKNYKIGKTLAHREIQDLVRKKILISVGKGKATHYALRK